MTNTPFAGDAAITGDLTSLNRSHTMELMQEALTREHMNARLSEAREQRRANLLARTQRTARRAEKSALQLRLLLARAS